MGQTFTDRARALSFVTEVYSLVQLTLVNLLNYYGSSRTLYLHYQSSNNMNISGYANAIILYFDQNVGEIRKELMEVGKKTKTEVIIPSDEDNSVIFSQGESPDSSIDEVKRIFNIEQPARSIDEIRKQNPSDI